LPWPHRAQQRHDPPARRAGAEARARSAGAHRRGTAVRQPRSRLHRPENLLVYGRYFGLPAAAIRARIPALLDFAGLSSKEKIGIRTLSGGMKRRLTLARALVNDPELLVLDEPTTGLDPQARHLIWDGLRKLLDAGKTILLTTHFMDEAERLCDRLVIVDSGRIIEEGTPRALIDAHFPVSPSPLRPANLEDVFLELTGRELRE